MTHTHRLFDAVPHDDKWRHEIEGATHYYGGPGGRDHLDEAVGHITDFLTRLR